MGILFWVIELPQCNQGRRHKNLRAMAEGGRGKMGQKRTQSDQFYFVFLLLSHEIRERRRCFVGAFTNSFQMWLAFILKTEKLNCYHFSLKNVFFFLTKY